MKEFLKVIQEYSVFRNTKNPTTSVMLNSCLVTYIYTHSIICFFKVLKCVFAYCIYWPCAYDLVIKIICKIMAHKFACWLSPSYDFCCWKFPCHLFRFSQEIILAKMPRFLFINIGYWKQYSVKQSGVINVEIYCDSLALFTTVVNKWIHSFWLKVLRTLHLTLIFCLICVTFKGLIGCTGSWVI